MFMLGGDGLTITASQRRRTLQRPLPVSVIREVRPGDDEAFLIQHKGVFQAICALNCPCHDEDVAVGLEPCKCGGWKHMMPSAILDGSSCAPPSVPYERQQLEAITSLCCLGSHGVGEQRTGYQKPVMNLQPYPVIRSIRPSTSSGSTTRVRMADVTRCRAILRRKLWPILALTSELLVRLPDINVTGVEGFRLGQAITGPRRAQTFMAFAMC